MLKSNGMRAAGHQGLAIFTCLALMVGGPSLAPVFAEEPEAGDETTIIRIQGPPLERVDVSPEAVQFETLYRFKGRLDGAWPNGDVVIDRDGIIYGTTQYDGDCDFYPNCGTVYLLKPPGAGQTQWTHTVIHRFASSPEKDGARPVAPLTLRGVSLYGTASVGGYPTCGCGIVFRLTPNNAAKTSWGYTVLHRFGPRHPPKGGSTPDGGVIFGPDGALYGTTAAGGQHSSGVVFKLTGGGGPGTWTDTILHHFDDYKGNPTSGPQGELIFGPDGALYGTTFGGGKYNQGTVFRLTRGGTHTVLYHFKGPYPPDDPGGPPDGSNPEGKLAFGDDGTLYGTTTFGGDQPSGYGTVWSLTPPGPGQTKWSYKRLHIFGRSGSLPHAGVVIAGNGVLFGTAAGGGRWQGGVVYKLAPPSAGSSKWEYSLLHSFQPRHKDGDIPWSVTSKGGTVFGTNIAGGLIDRPGVCRDGCGTVFKLKP